MTGRQRVRDLVAAALPPFVGPLGATVYRARTWPVTLPALPAVLVYGYEETKTSAAVTSPDERYDVSCQMVVQALVRGDTPEAVEAALEAFADAIEIAVLRCPALIGGTGTIEHIAGVKTKIEVPRASGDECLGEISMTFEMLWSEQFLVRRPGDDTDDSGFIGCTEIDARVHLDLGAPR